MKICGTCKQEKLLDEFDRLTRSRDGHGSICKQCSRKYGRNHYKKNREVYIKRTKEWYKKNREYSAKYSKEYRKKKFKIFIRL